MAPQLRCEDYTVAWVCALAVEQVAAEEMLDEEHDTPEYNIAHDTNIYTCGKIGEHNVVIACLPEGRIGTDSAAAVAVQMQSTFTSTRFGLMVGIGGGVPSEADIRLGDIVVSKPHTVHGGVVQYDSGKTTPSEFERTGSLNSPPTILLNAVRKVRTQHMRKKGKLLEYISKLAGTLQEFGREAAGSDALFEAEYNHEGGATCEKCVQDRVVARKARQEIVVHHGTIASGNQVMRDAAQRDKISAELGGVLCFEMEAAGLMNNFPCLVIRGICDYADSHKNKQWQGYAAGTAAAYAKEVLSVIPSSVVETEKKIVDVMSG
jgi:nucleoside phosphorylase